IYYTTDGSTPTTASTPYAGPFTLAQSATVRAVAAAAGMVNSDVASVAYAVKVSTPLVSPPGGTFTSSVTVTLVDSTPGAALYYTTDGSTPSADSTRYTAPFAVTLTATVRAIAIAAGMVDSDVVSATYTVKAAVPVIAPASGTYTSSAAVTITDATTGAAIYYTTD